MCSLHKFINSDGIHKANACEIQCMEGQMKLFFPLLARLNSRYSKSFPWSHVR